MSLEELNAMYEKKIAERKDARPDFRVAVISDSGSSLYGDMRAFPAFRELESLFWRLADIDVSVLSPKAFARMSHPEEMYNAVWLDNTFSQSVVSAVAAAKNASMDKALPGWKKIIEDAPAESREAVEKVISKIGALEFRAVYALDEYIWEAPAGRGRTLVGVEAAENAMNLCDAVVVPNGELSSAVREFGFVRADQEFLVIPFFVSDSLYPVNRINHKKAYGVSIRRPKVLVKGTVIPPKVQTFIIKNAKKYDITICTVCELDDGLMSLLRSGKVHNLVHWANPRVNSHNAVRTMAMERDCAFDFAIHTRPNACQDDIYGITMTDAEEVMSIASGAVAISEVGDCGYGEHEHVCIDSGLSFGRDMSADGLSALVDKWSSCAAWDDANDAQRKLLSERILSSPSIVAGYFNVLLGRDLAIAKSGKLKEAVNGKPAADEKTPDAAPSGK